MLCPYMLAEICMLFQLLSHVIPIDFSSAAA
uniref:Uncharacterized protein n=1 Tax=Rhizophora mucronata TaxID=61149 RepID=A0A2P2N7Z3_RHIMU